MPSLLIIDDDPQIAASLAPGFRKLSIDVVTATTAAQGLEQVVAQKPDAILLDIGLPDRSGLDLFWEIYKLDARIPTIIMTGQGTTETAIEAMKLGAYEYLHKPLSFTRTRDLVNQALEVARLMRVKVHLDDRGSANDRDAEPMIGQCESMREVYKMIGRVARQSGTVLIRGESGTGKELVARAIYQHSPRASAPFLAINCAAIPEALLESELFGHERGAFTGADQRRIGKFEQCSGGTLFLDEVGDMTPLTQAKVLRVLQDQQFERVGSNQTIRTDARTIAATHRDLELMVHEGTFRDDLYYRLNVFTIELPPLRERAEDLPLLVHALLRRFSREMGRDVHTAAPEALEILAAHTWPGNLRELQSVLKQALLQAAGPVLLPTFLPKSLTPTASSPTRAAAEATAPAPAPPPAATLHPDQADASQGDGQWQRFVAQRLQAGSQSIYAEWFARAERELLVQVLDHTGGNQLQAAKCLGITRRSLRGKIRTHGIAIERSISAHHPQHDS